MAWPFTANERRQQQTPQLSRFTLEPPFFAWLLWHPSRFLSPIPPSFVLAHKSAATKTRSGCTSGPWHTNGQDPSKMARAETLWNQKASEKGQRDCVEAISCSWTAKSNNHFKKQRTETLKDTHTQVFFLHTYFSRGNELSWTAGAPKLCHTAQKQTQIKAMRSWIYKWSGTHCVRYMHTCTVSETSSSKTLASLIGPGAPRLEH